jgi:phosphomannomutase|tara:strand:- start:509 stop:745 length:237 start_codon:yes stop_codon:yes gene_type:complete
MMQELLANKGVVLGFDQKKRSSTIAKILAAVLKKYGGAQIHLLDKFTTPGFLSYYTKVFGCVMGIMVTCEPISQNSSS